MGSNRLTGVLGTVMFAGIKLVLEFDRFRSPARQTSDRVNRLTSIMHQVARSNDPNPFPHYLRSDYRDQAEQGLHGTFMASMSGMGMWTLGLPDLNKNPSPSEQQWFRETHEQIYQKLSRWTMPAMFVPWLTLAVEGVADLTFSHTQRPSNAHINGMKAIKNTCALINGATELASAAIGIQALRNSPYLGDTTFARYCSIAALSFGITVNTVCGLSRLSFAGHRGLSFVNAKFQAVRGMITRFNGLRTAEADLSNRHANIIDGNELAAEKYRALTLLVRDIDMQVTRSGNLGWFSGSAWVQSRIRSLNALKAEVTLNRINGSIAPFKARRAEALREQEVGKKANDLNELLEDVNNQILAARSHGGQEVAAALDLLEKLKAGLEQDAKTFPPGEGCTVCLEAAIKGAENSVTLRKCKHVFHKQCIQGWFTQRQTCPNCRIRTNGKDVMPWK